ncbi:carboxy terminal-processing peptidase [Desulfobacula toluolica]|uniref:Prc: tail-specific protease n=1 Tax=Desulfobacula toluolica (strain DSM 7467 / Tol2) TaxID=651182 RepID=K0NAJ9_DESTT|nr:carboxy terminal-processing peptidase [Desulfobacula toluolica]CCK81069.1 Prc: tail-specific protease [Desulfobacula toluolica Tol2]
MTIKPIKNNYLITLFLLKYFLSVLILLSYSSPVWADIEKPIKPNFEHASQCIKIVRTLERYHYLEKKLDDNMSSIIFDRYLKRLDPGKLLFTREDIQSLKKYQSQLDDDLKRGSLTIAFKIFNLYMERSRQRLEYISSMIPTWEKNFDFSKNDSMIIDNDVRKWEPDSKALYSLWRNDLKNHIITMILDDQENASITETLDKTYSSRLKRLLQTNSNDIFQIFMNSVTMAFDPHTQFFPPRASEDFDIHMSLSLEGIGAVLQNEYEYTKVVRLIPKGPADKSNLLMPGDKIIGVGQGETGEIKDTIGQRIDDVVKLIRGPRNTVVRLKIIPAKKSNSTRTIKIKRDQVKLEEQSAKKNIITLDHNNHPLKIGVIEIPNFYIDFNAFYRGDKDYKSTTKDVKKLLVELKNENIDGLIIDLRDNGGGSLKEANELTGLFLKSGPTVQIRTKYRITRLYDDDPTIEYSGPLIVLINRMSASASEIFAGAIKDYHRGVIVGTRSFGKGTVQELQPLGKGKLKLTSAKFYRVSGKSTQNLGIVPDLSYPQLYKIEDTGESSLEGALPWDTTIKTSYKAYRSLQLMNEKLDTGYQKRSLKDPGVTYLKKRIEIASKINSQTSISLNLDARKSEKKLFEQSELDVENNYLISIGKAPIEKFDPETTKINDFKEIMMNQTHLVMADFIELSHDFDFSW